LEAVYGLSRLRLDDNGSIVNVRELEAPDDSEAVEQARKYLDGYDLEVWQRDRKVKLLPGKG
jgi:hypothetical protein